MIEILRENGSYMLTEALIGEPHDDQVPDRKYTLLSPEIPEGHVSLGRLRDGSSEKGIVTYLEILGIHIEEASCTQIVEVFQLLLPNRTILRSTLREDIPYATERFLQRLQAYTGAIAPPSFSVEGEVRKITLWTADLWAGKLERWVISEDSEGNRQIESEEM